MSRYPASGAAREICESLQNAYQFNGEGIQNFEAPADSQIDKLSKQRESICETSFNPSFETVDSYGSIKEATARVNCQ